MGRNVGSVDLKPRKKSLAQTVQKQNAWVKALEARTVEPDDAKRKPGMIKEKITDGTKHMRKIQDFSLNLPEGLTEEQKDHLFIVGRNALMDITQNPLMFVAKEAAQLKMDMARQQLEDNREGEIFSKNKEKMLKLLLEIAKISQRAEEAAKKTGRKVYDVKEQEFIIEADRFK